jgi:hypothetical protein
MTTDPSRPFSRFAFGRCRRRSTLLIAGMCLSASMLGCSKPAPVVTYTIPTKVPEEFRASKERMLAAMFPKGDDIWFFKVSGPEEAISQIDSAFRTFIETVEFTQDTPDLSQLPDGWRQGGSKPFRVASIDINTPLKQLDVSVSKLPRQENWDDQVSMNVNRWRGQLGLQASDDPWAGGEAMKVAVADGDGVWVDLLGDPATSPSMASMGRMPDAASRPPGSELRESVPVDPHANLTTSVGPTSSAPGASAEPDSRLDFALPSGWRRGRMTSMRMAAFDLGPEDAPAELTVIPAGGDLRGNVARWLGQVRGEANVADEIVDKAMSDAEKLDVDGRASQRFVLSGDDASEGDMIDATIVPMEGGISLFVKVFGPAETVTQQREAIASFLKSLKLNL